MIQAEADSALVLCQPNSAGVGVVLGRGREGGREELSGLGAVQEMV